MKPIAFLALMVLSGCSSPVVGPSVVSDSTVLALEFSDVKVRFQPPAPPYPQQAKFEKVAGTVVVEITINQSGVPTQATAISGPKELREASAAYALNWRFEPVMFQGTPHSAKFKIRIPYRIR